MLKFSPLLSNFWNKADTTFYHALTCAWFHGGWGMYMIDSRYCQRRRACSVLYTSSYKAWYRDTPSMAALTRDGNPGQCQRSNVTPLVLLHKVFLTFKLFRNCPLSLGLDPNYDFIRKR